LARVTAGIKFPMMVVTAKIKKYNNSPNLLVVLHLGVSAFGFSFIAHGYWIYKKATLRFQKPRQKVDEMGFLTVPLKGM